MVALLEEDCSTRDDFFQNFFTRVEFFYTFFFVQERMNHFLYLCTFFSLFPQPCQHEKCFGLLSTFYFQH